MGGIGRESGTSRCGHVRYNIVCLWINFAGPTKRFGMVRVLLDLSEIRSEMVRISNAMIVVLVRLQCAFSGRVHGESGMLLPISLNRNCLLSMSCVRAGHNPLAEVVWDFGLLFWLKQSLSKKSGVSSFPLSSSDVPSSVSCVCVAFLLTGGSCHSLLCRRM